MPCCKAIFKAHEDWGTGTLKFLSMLFSLLDDSKIGVTYVFVGQ